MKQIWLVRHGESRSQTGEEPGLDPPLSQRGEAQAKRLRARLSAICFDHVLISPLKRARQTWALSGVSASQMRYDSRVIECGLGQSYASLLPYDMSDRADPDVHDAWLVDPVERARHLSKHLPLVDASCILLFGHWAIFNLLLQCMMGNHDPREPIRGETYRSAVMDNCGISIIGMDHERFGQCLVSWNDVRHVKDLIRIECSVGG